MKSSLRFIAIILCLLLFSLCYIFRQDWELVLVGFELGPFRDLDTKASQYYYYVFVKLSKYIAYEVLTWAILLLAYPRKDLLHMIGLISLFRLVLLIPLYAVFRNTLGVEWQLLKAFIHNLAMNPILPALLLPAYWLQENLPSFQTKQ